MKRKHIFSVSLLLFFFLFTTAYTPNPTYAIVNPLAVPNNKFGIHIIQATPDESSPAASLVNTNGDWGYITVLIESKDRNHNKWQEFFNDLRRRHLIPIVRLATQPEGDYWKRPYEGEEIAWADFLDALNWPTKNRYVIIYNEPNHSTEWGNRVDAANYAETLDKTITALKNKNQDFFVLNAGLDASAPEKLPAYEDQVIFMQEMDQAVPGIFEKLDGWVSHSYPNPGFMGSPDGIGRGTVRTYFWELQQLRNLGVSKNLPIFITETGWKHAEGIDYNRNLPTTEIVAKYFQEAFTNAWKIDRIAAVTPFLLSYQEEPFDHFSLKRITGEKQNKKILGIQYPDNRYYSIYQAIQDLPKVAGKPVQETKAQLAKGEIYSSIVADETYTISLTFKNTGQSIWNDSSTVKLVPTQGAQDLGIASVILPDNKKIEPGQEYTFNLNVKAPQSGTYHVAINLFTGEKQFDSPPLQFTTRVKPPVILKIIGALEWKKNYEGVYKLKIKGVNGENTQNIILNKGGISDEMEARYLLPDYPFEFSLEKPFYKAKSINKKVYAGVNVVDFGILQPDILPAIFYPMQLWKILPFSN